MLKKISTKYVFDIKIEYKEDDTYKQSILYAWAKQYNTRYGQFGFYWNVEELGLGIMLVGVMAGLACMWGRFISCGYWKLQ